MPQDQYIQLDSLPEEVRKKVLDFIEDLMGQWEQCNKKPEPAQRKSAVLQA